VNSNFRVAPVTSTRKMCFPSEGPLRITESLLCQMSQRQNAMPNLIDPRRENGNGPIVRIDELLNPFDSWMFSFWNKGSVKGLLVIRRLPSLTRRSIDELVWVRICQTLGPGRGRDGNAVYGSIRLTLEIWNPSRQPTSPLVDACESCRNFIGAPERPNLDGSYFMPSERR
jgi:hypothetical protein